MAAPIPVKLLAAMPRGSQLLFDTVWIGVGTTTSLTNLPNANANFDVDGAGQQLLPEATNLTGARVYTLPTPAAARKRGMLFSYVRTNTQAQGTQVKDGPSNNVIFPVGSDTEPAPPYIATFFWDGSNWAFTGYIPVVVTR